MTYITNSSSTFNLDSDKIIYASDAGVPSTMVTAMMERDRFLQQQFAASQAAQQAQQTEPAQPTETTPPAGPPPADATDVASQPDTQPAPVTVNYFNDSLAPYGSWVVVNGYGRCWRPTVCVYNSSWQPYCDRGRWVYSDCGWYWNSDYAWGATFHYGRWFRDASVGWCWYPDTVLGAVVGDVAIFKQLLRLGGAVAAAHELRRAWGIVYNGGGVSVGLRLRPGRKLFHLRTDAVFCSPHPRNYCVPPVQVTQVYNNTTVINNYNVNNRTIVNHGIAVGSIVAATHTTIQPVPVHEINAGYLHGHYGQPIYRSSQTPGTYHPGYYGNSSLPVQTVGMTQNHFSPAAQNWSASQATQPQRSPAVATIPQRQMPAANYDLAQTAPAQAPPANLNSSQPTEPTEWQPARSTATPRNVTHNYGARQNYYAPQHPVPANVPASAPSQQGSYHGGNQSGPGH